MEKTVDMKPRALLLIGTEKTGSTTIQQFLASNRAQLAARGFVYPSFCGDQNHTGLAAYALDPDRQDDIRVPFGIQRAEDVPAMRARIEAAAREELAREKLGSATGTVIFCNEHCHSRLTRRSEVERLHALLHPFFDEIKIAVYLRRQDQVALSLYATQIKSGATHRSLIPVTSADDPFYNYDRSLRLWADVFGESNIVPRIFDRAALVGGSVVPDFCAAWGLGPVAEYRAVPDFNGSVDAAAIEFLRHANMILDSGTVAGHPSLRGRLTGHVEAQFPGRGPRPSKAEAMAFYNTFHASNLALCRRYFPDRASLFDETFDAYPEVADPRAFDLCAAVNVGLRLSMAAMADIRRLESEIALRDGRLHWAARRTEQAVAALRSAVALSPQHPEMQRTLAEYLFQTGQFDQAASAATAAVEQRPQSAEYWHFLGLALRRCGRKAEAADAQGRALALQPDYPAARAELDLVGHLASTPDIARATDLTTGSPHDS